MVNSNALDFVTGYLNGKRQKFATVYPAIYRRNQFDVMNYVTFRWMTCGFIRLVTHKFERKYRSALEMG